MTERDGIKQRLVRAIFKFNMFAVNRRFMLEGCCFLVVTIQEPDIAVFLFLKKLPYDVLVFLNFVLVSLANTPNFSSIAVQQFSLMYSFLSLSFENFL